MRNLVVLACLSMMACSNPDRTEAERNDALVTLRNLADTGVAASAPVKKTVQGDLIPTPSDEKSRYYLLRQRRAVSGNIIAILRQERGDRVAYARIEADCSGRLFHILGVGASRRSVEVDMTTDGPLRPIAGLPLRIELARFVCARGDTPLVSYRIEASGRQG